MTLLLGVCCSLHLKGLFSPPPPSIIHQAGVHSSFRSQDRLHLLCQGSSLNGPLSWVPLLWLISICTELLVYLLGTPLIYELLKTGTLSVTTVSVALFLTVSKICVDCMNENFPPIYWVALAQEKLRDKNMQDLQATFWNEESLRVLSLNWLMEGVASEALRGCPWLFSPLFSTRPPTTFPCRTSFFQVSQMCISLLCKVHESRIYNFIFAYTCCLAHSRYLIVKWNEWNLKKGRHTASSDKTIHSVSNIFSVESLLPLAQPLLSYICIVLLLFKLLSHPLSDFILTFTLRSMQFRSHYLPVTTY